MADFINNLKFWWKTKGMAFRLILINVAIFLLIRVAALVIMFTPIDFSPILNWITLPPSFNGLTHEPWTLLTYMFCHYDVFHILFNMLWLYWFGQLFTMLCTQKQLLVLYFYGGIAGALLYLSLATTTPWIGGGGLLGASAAIMAIVIATAVINPDYQISLLLIGYVKLKWVAVVTFILFLLGIAGNNAGGDIAHIGGAIMGAIYGLAYRKGVDITRPVNRLLDWIFSLNFNLSFNSQRNKGSQPHQKAPQQSASSNGVDMARIDSILDKIKKSGYQSLNNEEKKILFEASSRLK